MKFFENNIICNFAYYYSNCYILYPLYNKHYVEQEKYKIVKL